MTGAFVVSDALPYLRWLDIGGYEKAMKKTAKELDQMVGEWLQEHKQRKPFGGMKEHHDFMDVLLSTVTDEAEISSYDADTIIKATCLVRVFFFFLAPFFFITILIPYILYTTRNLAKYWIRYCS